MFEKKLSNNEKMQQFRMLPRPQEIDNAKKDIFIFFSHELTQLIYLYTEMLFKSFKMNFRKQNFHDLQTSGIARKTLFGTATKYV